MRVGSRVQTRQGPATVVGPDPAIPHQTIVRLDSGAIIPVNTRTDRRAAIPIIGHAWATDLDNGLICTWPDETMVRAKAQQQQLTILQIIPTAITRAHIEVGRLVVLCDEHGTPVIGAGS